MRMMIMNLQKLAIQTSQTQRQVLACLFLTILAPQETEFLAAGVGAGRLYHEQVKKAGKGHKLGAPHPHIAVAVIEAAAKSTAKEEHRNFLQSLLEAWGITSPQAAIDQPLVDDLLPIIVCRELETFDKNGKKKEKKAKAKAEAGGGAAGAAAAMDTSEPGPSDRSLLQVAIQPLTRVRVGDLVGIQVAAFLKMVLEDLTKQAGGEVGRGGPPPGRSERKVQTDMKKLNNSKQQHKK